MCMRSGMLDEQHKPESLCDIIRDTAVEFLGLPIEAASSFAQIASARATGFFFRFDNVPDSLTFRNIIYDGMNFIIEWDSVSEHADCPECGKTSGREQSRHLFPEKIQDVGIHGKGLWHSIRRKKYICTNDHCIQKVFIEGFPGFVEMRNSQMTVEFVTHILQIAVSTSCEAAATQLREQGAKISGDTVIRTVLRHGAHAIEKNFYENAGDVVIAGIDDINLRKGNSGTSCMVVVDLDTMKLIAIARGTTGETAQQVLSMFPNLQIVSRDRGTAMASAANTLGKKSVADRYHITANMHDAILKTLYETLPKTLYIPVGNSGSSAHRETMPNLFLPLPTLYAVAV